MMFNLEKYYIHTLILRIMSIEENKMIVLRSFKEFDKGELKTIEDLTASNFIDHNPLRGKHEA